MTVQYGKAFRWVRIAQGFTQEDFAGSSGRTYVSELERGVKQPTVGKLEELSEALGVHPLTILALAYSPKGTLKSVEKLLDQVRAEIEHIISEVPVEPTGAKRLRK